MKLGFFDVSKAYSSNSENKSWGDSGDDEESDDVSDDDGKGDVEKTDASHDDVAQETVYEQVQDDSHKAQAERKRYIDLVEESVKDIINDEVKTQLPQILPKATKPLSLIMNQGRQVVLVDIFINNDLKYLKGGSSTKKYMSLTTKTKAAKYDIPGIEDMIPYLWSLVKNQRDLPRDNPLVSVEVLRYDIKRSKSKNKGIVWTEIELVLEQTQQGTSYEVSNIRVIPKYHSEDGNPARANIKQALSRRLFLRLNLSDHRSVLTGSGGSSKGGDEDTLF
uniref:Uncharacterized protein n=1 Tax=Tanacetum cinerariifolium TaxID=118510 RepID=A0A6L2KLN4_TANCI|nr:hypothetical protein [Tanacetum cinerariifolium]